MSSVHALERGISAEVSQTEVPPPKVDRSEFAVGLICVGLSSFSRIDIRAIDRGCAHCCSLEIIELPYESGRMIRTLPKMSLPFQFRNSYSAAVDLAAQSAWLASAGTLPAVERRFNSRSVVARCTQSLSCR